MNRLQSATETVASSQTWKQTFLYDRYGNRQFDAANTTTLVQSNNITNPTISTANNRFSGGQGYGYNANGDLTLDATGKQFVYDAESRQTSFGTGGSNTNGGTYLYDGEGRRVKKVTNLETTIFVYDAAGQLAAEYATQTAQTPQVSYLTTDHLGSPRVITDANGAVISRKDFAAFGDETITAQRTTGLGYTPPNVRQDYTGYEKDGESGLEYAQARYYNSSHGRFTSVDPLTASASIRNPQTFNRYSYALNSPYKFTDPLGLAVGEVGQALQGTARSDTCAAEFSSCEVSDFGSGGRLADGEARYESILNDGYDPETNRYVNTVTITNRGNTTVTKPTLDDVVALVDLMNLNNAHLAQYEENAARREWARVALRNIPGANYLEDTLTEGLRFSVVGGKQQRIDFAAALTQSKVFTSGPTIHHGEPLGCKEKGARCNDYRGKAGAFGITGSIQIVYNAASGEGYIDVDRYNPHDFPGGTFNHIVLEILLKGGVPDRPEILNRASNVRDLYRR